MRPWVSYCVTVVWILLESRTFLYLTNRKWLSASFFCKWELLDWSSLCVPFALSTFDLRLFAWVELYVTWWWPLMWMAYGLIDVAELRASRAGGRPAGDLSSWWLCILALPCGDGSPTHTPSPCRCIFANPLEFKFPHCAKLHVIQCKELYLG